MLTGPADSPDAVCTVSFVHAMRSLGRYAIIQEMYVVPERRSSGIGKELLEAALAAAIERGAAFVELGTPLHGTRQVQFYERSGFTSVGERLRWRPATD
jgi:ribosomal protein S18 acetylase RimI-like enzyme